MVAIDELDHRLAEELDNWRLRELELERGEESYPLGGMLYSRPGRLHSNIVLKHFDYPEHVFALEIPPSFLDEPVERWVPAISVALRYEEFVLPTGNIICERRRV